MKHFFRFQLFTLILLLSCAFQIELKAQIDATKTPDWVQRLKKIPLQQADTAALDSIRNTIQGKEFNPETGKWEWRQFPYGLVKEDISNHSLQQLSEDTMKLYSLSDGFDGVLKADSLGNLYKDTSDLISFGFQYNPSFIDVNNVTGKSIEFGDTTGQYKFNMEYKMNRWSNEINIFNDNRKQYEPERPEYGISRYSIWWHGTNHVVNGEGAFISDWKTIWENREGKQGNGYDGARAIYGEGRGRREFDENQEPTGKYLAVEPNTNISIHRFYAYTPRPEDSSKVRGHLVGAYGFGTGSTDTLRYNENNGGQYHIYLAKTGETAFSNGFHIPDTLTWQGDGYKSNLDGLSYFDVDGVLQKSDVQFQDLFQFSDFDDGNTGYFKMNADGSFEKVTPTEAFLGLAKDLPQYQNDSAAQAIGDLTVYEDFYINAETGAITKVLIPLPVCDFGTPTAFDKSSQADPIRFFQLYYNNGGVFPSTSPQVGDSVTVTIDGTAHIMTVQSIIPGLSIALSCPDDLHTQFGNGYYNNLISNMTSFTIECN